MIPVGAEVFLADGRTDGQTYEEANIYFFNFALARSSTENTCDGQRLVGAALPMCCEVHLEHVASTRNVFSLITQLHIYTHLSVFDVRVQTHLATFHPKC